MVLAGDASSYYDRNTHNEEATSAEQECQF